MTNNILAKTLTIVGVIGSLATSGIAGYKVFANHEVSALETPKLSSPSPSAFPSSSPETSSVPLISPDLFPVASPVSAGNLFEGSDDEDDRIELEDHDQDEDQDEEVRHETNTAETQPE